MSDAVAIQPEWFSDVLTELSGIAHGYAVNLESVRRVIRAVPTEHLVKAGLSPFGYVDDPEMPDRDHGIRRPL